MTDYNAQKKAEHEKLADVAITAGDWESAVTNLALAAKFTLALSEQCEGAVAVAHFNEATQLAEYAIKLRERAENSVRAVNDDGDAEGEESQVKATIRHDTNVRLDDVKGLDEAKLTVQELLINPVKYPDSAKKADLSPGKGLLLYGPPGTGKTMFARAIAGELDLPFIYRRASELKDKYVGGSEKNTVQLFKEAYSYKRSIVFLDEADAILSATGNQKANIVTSFISELDGFEKHSDAHVFVLLATNKPWLIDSRVQQRIGAAVYVGLPNAEVRKDIFSAALRNSSLADDVKIDELVALTDGYSGRELAGDGPGLCNVAKAIAFNRSIAQKKASVQQPLEDGFDVVVNRDDFMKALKRVVPETRKDPTFLKRNLAWSLNRSSDSPSEGEDEN